MSRIAFLFIYYKYFIKCIILFFLQDFSLRKSIASVPVLQQFLHIKKVDLLSVPLLKP